MDPNPSHKEMKTNYFLLLPPSLSPDKELTDHKYDCFINKNSILHFGFFYSEMI